ncbi:hypothetical protein C8F01DRAFT_1255018 [Mycena amicta]|nr:hypothetical protein C8F01DRAFT_1255018 [Mycena amicta]
MLSDDTCVDLVGRRFTALEQCVNQALEKRTMHSDSILDCRVQRALAITGWQVKRVERFNRMMELANELRADYEFAHTEFQIVAGHAECLELDFELSLLENMDARTRQRHQRAYIAKHNRDGEREVKARMKRGQAVVEILVECLDGEMAQVRAERVEAVEVWLDAMEEASALLTGVNGNSIRWSSPEAMARAHQAMEKDYERQLDPQEYE